MSIENYPNCGGTHIGHDKCPFTLAPCSVCAEPTILACSDCAIETGKSVHVCKNVECRLAHDQRHPSHAALAKAEEQK